MQSKCQQIIIYVMFLKFPSIIPRCLNNILSFNDVKYCYYLFIFLLFTVGNILALQTIM